ncbi:MAG: CidA/LrgA family protein [Tissierellia bacterium]|nr:CidA/LrgA family protein [Tissierellia bacterium]
MEKLKQLGIILGILFIGNILEGMIVIPIPGAVSGMVLLLFLLLMGVVELRMVEDVSKVLLDHLLFLFVPAGVGIISQLHIIRKEWLPILMIIIISTVLAILSTAMTIQGLRKISRGREE